LPADIFREERGRGQLHRNKQLRSGIDSTIYFTPTVCCGKKAPAIGIAEIFFPVQCHPSCSVVCENKATLIIEHINLKKISGNTCSPVKASQARGDSARAAAYTLFIKRIGRLLRQINALSRHGF